MQESLQEKVEVLQDTHWWYVSQRELVKSFLKERFKEKKCLLDVGAGTGGMAKAFAGDFDVFALDLSKKASKILGKKKINAIRGNAVKLPFKSNSFNVVLAVHLLEHVEDDFQAVKEMNRVLKKKGVLILSVPALNLLWGSDDVISGHLRRYSIQRLERVLANFKEKELFYWNFFIFIPTLIQRLLSRGNLPKTDAPMVLRHSLFSKGPLNNFILGLLRIEIFLIQKGIPLPFGVNLSVIASK